MSISTPPKFVRRATQVPEMQNMTAHQKCETQRAEVGDEKGDLGFAK